MKEGRSIFGLYPPSAETKAEFEAWKKARKNTVLAQLLSVIIQVTLEEESCSC